MVKTHALSSQAPETETAEGETHQHEHGDTDVQDVLAANRRFYRAFADRDVAGMEALWAQDRDVRCVHPGWPVLSGREPVMRSWRELLGNPRSPGVRHQSEQATVCGDIGWVVCEEFVANTALVVTNLFARSGGGWQMIHHQATPISSIAAFEDASGYEDLNGRPPTLH
ncbi:MULTISPECIES: nuclear transport factor 2 family protein [Nitrospirillum]|uniref:SnoaL-like protein n=1 Tax=Nitrospirillum amazonense TaxID=28077 RepID=A0A560FRF8_9PROT|nr:nuclear transport factor 2 family protein [Nitrospirillum amazonense]MEC4591448.1 nuclear transport factor 2 family protein [Nitrospirillum amazonense]TWB24172.1 SnoaL-like protein [Nitrospirillum amazonense]